MGSYRFSFLNCFVDLTFLAGTRKEEIARFNKARTDDGFAKMLKARTLGPEHLETQTQLRRDIRVSIGQLFQGIQLTSARAEHARSDPEVGSPSQLFEKEVGLGKEWQVSAQVLPSRIVTSRTPINSAFSVELHPWTQSIVHYATLTLHLTKSQLTSILLPRVLPNSTTTRRARAWPRRGTLAY